MRPAVAVIYFIGGLLAVLLAFDGVELAPLFALAVIVVIAASVAGRSTFAGLFTLIAPIAVLVMLRGGNPTVLVIGVGVSIGVGIALSGREQLSLAVTAVALLAFSSLLALVLPNPSVWGYLTIAFIVLPVTYIALVASKLRALTLEPLDQPVVETLPDHVAAFVALGFEVAAAYTTIGQPIGIMVHKDGATWVETNLSARHRIWDINSHGGGVRFQTTNRNTMAVEDDEFVQLALDSVEDSVAWHAAMVEAATSQGWVPEPATREVADLALRRGVAELRDYGWRDTANMILRLVSKDYIGVRGPVDASSPELLDFLSRHSNTTA